jgi:hypothetical protein
MTWLTPPLPGAPKPNPPPILAPLRLAHDALATGRRVALPRQDL